MASSIKARLALLTTLICLLAFVIGWAAHTSWQEVGHLKERFSRAHLNSFEIADHVIDNITERFWLLTRRPHIGRTRDDLRPGLLSFPSGNYVII